jgi:hypothetical protein
MMRFILAAFLAIAPGCAVGAVLSNDHSGTIILGGTAQTVISANASRVGCELQVLGSTSIWINVSGTAAAGQGSTEIPPGSVFTCPFPVSADAISIFGTATGTAFTAKEYTR